MTTRESLKILHLASSERWTGVAEPATSLACTQARMGHETWLAMIPGRSFEEEAVRRGARVVTGIDLVRRYNPWRIRAAILGLREFLAANAIQVVHAHLLHDHWLAALAVRGMPPGSRPAVVRTVHRYETMRTDPVHRWLFEQATGHVITVSSQQRSMILSAYPSLEDRCSVVAGGVDPERFHPDPAGRTLVRGDMGEKPSTPVAGIVAHLGYKRGHDWLLRAVPQVLDAVPECSIWIVGQGEIKYRLRKEIAKPVYRNRVVMAGYRGPDLPETYAALDVLLLLALGSEGSARAALEAMATGKPVIAVKKGALIDTVTDGTDGLLVTQDSDEELARAMIRLLGNPAEAMRMGENARRKIVESLTEDHRAARTLDMYCAALARPQPARPAS